MSQAILAMSEEYALCVCVGLAELDGTVVYNSQMVADRGTYLGLQRKINLSGDEYCHFGTGESVEVFDIGDLRFGITICYDNHFPEIALVHSLNGVDLILAPHAARTGVWPRELTPEFCAAKIRSQQESWEKVHRARAYDHNVFVLLCNAVGPSTEGLGHVVANHAGTVMGVGPTGNIILRTSRTDFSDEIASISLSASDRVVNHGPTRNRRPATVLALMEQALRRGRG